MSGPEAGQNPKGSDTTSSSRKPTNIYRVLTAIPILGDIVRISNSYAYSGDAESDTRLAPVYLWVKRLWMNLVTAALLTLIPTFSLFFNCKRLDLFPALRIAEKIPEPGALITSILPNILGFGLGVYALIFALSSSLLQNIHRQIRKNKKIDPSIKGSVLILNSDMAYPLLVMTISLGIGIIQTILEPTRPLVVITWFALWYSGLMVLEVLMAIFGLGENELLGKINENSDSN